LSKRELAGAPKGLNARRSVSTALSTYGLVVLGVLLVIVFSIALPQSFPTALTVQGILQNQTTVLLLALGLTVVIASGEFDLSIGYGVGMTYVFTIGFIVKGGIAWPLAVVLVLLIGLGLGLVNGILVHIFKIDSFIATLGSGTICYGIVLWYTGGQQILGNLPTAFTNLAGQFDLGIPQPAVIAVVIALILFVLLDLTPVGRYLYALGFNRRAAELSGISTRRYGIAAFAISGLIIGIAGVLLGSRLQIANSATGAEFLLPAFVGALLGKTTIRPGRTNIIGTLIAVIVLAVGIAGLEQLGGQFYVESLFNGFTLIIAVGIAGYVARRRTRAKASPPATSTPDDPDIALSSTSTDTQPPVAAPANGAARDQTPTR
jgi:ribose transport system permease protein